MPAIKMSDNFNRGKLSPGSSIRYPLYNNMEPAKVQTNAAINKSTRLGTAGLNLSIFFTCDPRSVNSLVPETGSFATLQELQDANEMKNNDII